MKLLYNVLDFGAVPNREGNQTRFFQEAVDACAKEGGGEVFVPAGTYTIASLRMRSHVTLHLGADALLLGSTDVDDYVDFPDFASDKSHITLAQPISWEREVRKRRAVICASQETDLAIIGDGNARIDGQNTFDPLGEEGFRGPRGISFFHCDDVELSGFTFENCANHALACDWCNNVVMRRLKVVGGHDGINFSFAQNVLVENCSLICGDDCVAFAFAKNVIMKDCLVNTCCNLFRIGGSDVLLDNCVCQGPAVYGHRMTLSDEELRARVSALQKGRRNICTAFLYFCFDPGIDYPHDKETHMRIQNCQFDYVDCLAFFRYDENLHQTYRTLGDLTIKNTVATNVSGPVIVRGKVDEPVDLRMENVRLTAREGFEKKPVFLLENCHSVVLHNVTAEGYEHATAVNMGRVENIVMKNCTAMEVEDY